MALVGEAGRQGDFGEGRIGSRELVAGKLHSPTADEVTDGASVMAAKACSNVNRMDVRSFREFGQGRWLSESIGEEIAQSCQPAWRMALHAAEGASPGFSENLQRQPLNRQGSGLIRALKFRVEPQRQARDRTPAEVGCPVESRQLPPIQRGFAKLDVERPCFLIGELLRMNLARCMKGDRKRATGSMPPVILLSITTAADEAEIGVFMTMARHVSSGRITGFDELQVADDPAARDSTEELAAQ